MTIWSGRTQRSIASGFAAASVNGNRTLRSVVPSGQRVLRSVAAPMNTATPTPPSIHQLLQKRANQQSQSLHN